MLHNTHDPQELLERYCFASGSPAPTSFELLSKSLSLYVRLCMHKRAEPRSSSGNKRRAGAKKGSDDCDGDGREDKGGEEFVSEVKGVLEWCGRVVVPALNESISKG